MKTAKPRTRRSASTRRPGAAAVTTYIDRAPAPARARLKKIRAAIRSVVPREATEVISYRMPAFRYRIVLVWYAAFADHCSLFPTSSIVEAFKNDLSGFVTRKGTIQFPTHKPLPIPLIKRIVKARVVQVEKKKR
jgi:uncharacterized protein YdhG (YjbR/CyaY superfamily)